MVVAVLFRAGLHVPLIPLFEVVGKAARLAPEHIDATWAKAGITIGFTVMLMVAVVAHCPALGVNV